MGEVVGARLLAHVPTMVLPESTRRQLNNGNDSTLVAGLRQLRNEVFDVLEYETVVVCGLTLGNDRRVRCLGA